MDIKKDIDKAKKALIERATTKGIYENFGQKEVNKVMEKHLDSSSYTDEMEEKRRQVREFCDWCLNYNG